MTFREALKSGLLVPGLELVDTFVGKCRVECVHPDGGIAKSGRVYAVPFFCLHRYDGEYGGGHNGTWFCNSSDWDEHFSLDIDPEDPLYCTEMLRLAAKEGLL